MTDYTHHNTSINILDILVDTTLPSTSLKQFTNSGVKSDPKKRYIPHEMPKGLDSDEEFVMGEPTNGVLSCVEHPVGVAVKAVLLDDRDHLLQ
ncbi:hypothetical protein HDU76_010779 [Blyttiomyces sp. JEL0837]|nr:hypothetical protein HDU76_010779 [Blyttiomyces sp. JEL0837]